MAALAVLGICVAAMAAVDLAAHGTGHKPVRCSSHPYSDSPRFDRLSMDDGLSSDDVFAVLQNREGFMWFGTKDGLNRFDGYSFRVYRFDLDVPTSISHNDVRTMLEDRDGSLWIATSGGLDRFDP
ncbi:MAG: ligand-binding sensor domain-containing protein, partial [Bacteroidota bacterium]